MEVIFFNCLQFCEVEWGRNYKLYGPEILPLQKYIIKYLQLLTKTQQKD